MRELHPVHHTPCCRNCAHRVVVRYNHHEVVRCQLDHHVVKKNYHCDHYLHQTKKEDIYGTDSE